MFFERLSELDRSVKIICAAVLSAALLLFLAVAFRPLGGAVQDDEFAEGERVSADGYTFIMGDISVDENGIGVLRAEILYPSDSFTPIAPEHLAGEQYEPVGLELYWEKDGSNEKASVRGYPDRESSAEGRAVYEYFFVPYPSPLPEDGVLTAGFSVYEDGSRQTARGELEVVLPEPVEARTMKAFGVTAYLSPLGLRLIYEFDSEHDKSLDALILRYDDGSEISVIGNGKNDLARMGGLDRETFIAFNSRVEVQSVSEIYVTGTCGAPFEFSLH